MQPSQSREITEELYFLIAKFLRAQFPAFGDVFTKECEQRHLFPSRVFSKTPSFEDLDKKYLFGIPDDQILRLISLACPKSEFPSVLFSQHKPLEKISIADSIISNLGPPIPPLTGLAPSHRIVGHFDKIFCLAIDATSQLLFTGADDFVVKIWKLPDLTLVKSIPGHTNVITDVAVHPTNKYFASSSHDHTIGVYYVSSGSLKTTLQMSNEVHAIRFSRNGKFLAAAGQEGSIKIWSVDAEADSISDYLTVPTPLELPAAWIDFSPGGEFLAFAADPNIIAVISLTEKSVVRLEGFSKSPDFVFFSRLTAYKVLALATKERGIRVWNSKDNLWENQTQYNARGPSGTKLRFSRCAWNCDETRMVAISSTSIVCWESSSKKAVCTLTHPLYTDHCMLLAPHPTLPSIIFVACASGRSSLWDINSSSSLFPLQSEEAPKPSEAVWSKDGQFIYVADLYGGVTIHGYPSNAFTTTEQFFQFETVDDDSVSEDEDRTVVDSNGTALDPQPKVYRIEDLELSSKLIEISERVKDEEQQILKAWKKNVEGMNESKIGEIEYFSRESETQSDEEKPQSIAESGDEFTENEVAEHKEDIVERRELRRMGTRSEENEELKRMTTRSRRKSGENSDEEKKPAKKQRKKRAKKVSNYSGQESYDESSEDNAMEAESESFEESSDEETPKRAAKRKIERKPKAKVEYSDEEIEEEIPKRRTKSRPAISGSETEESEVETSRRTTTRTRRKVQESSDNESPKRRKAKQKIAEPSEDSSDYSFEDSDDVKPKGPAPKKQATKKATRGRKKFQGISDDESPKRRNTKQESSESADENYDSSFEESDEEKPKGRAAKRYSSKKVTPKKQKKTADYSDEEIENEMPKRMITRKRKAIAEYSDIETEEEEEEPKKATAKGRRKNQKESTYSDEESSDYSFEESNEEKSKRKNMKRKGKASEYSPKRKTIKNEESSESELSDTDSETGLKNDRPKRRAKSAQKVKQWKPDADDYEGSGSEESDDDVLPKWISWCSPSDHPPIPQKGEEVAYFKGGHRKYIAKANSLRLSRPYLSHPDLPSMEYARLDDIVFHHKCAVITLRFRGSATFTAQVEIPIPEEHQFIVAKETYENSVSYCGRLSVGEEITFWEVLDGEQRKGVAEVVDFQKNWRRDPFESIEVKRQADGQIIRISPWQVCQSDQRQRNATKLAKVQKELSIKVQELIKDFPDFKRSPSDKESKVILRIHQRPIGLNLIQARLSGFYYQHVLQIIDDIKMLQENAKFVQGQDEEGASELVKVLISSLGMSSRSAGLWFPSDI